MEIPTKISMAFFTKIEKPALHMELQGAPKSQNNLEKEQN